MQPKEITKLKTAIRETNGCDSRHVKSVPVTEIFRGKIVWDGIVEVFDLIDHPRAKRAFAWSYREGEEEKSTVVLGIPPVDSPHAAVIIAVASKARDD
jgi:hypothetical protein